MSPHFEQTVKRIHESQSEYILLIQDGMRLNYTTHQAKTDIGRIGKAGGKDQYGLIQHSALCLTDKNEPLGLIDVRHFHYDEIDTSTHHHHRQIEDKATRYWLDSFRAAKERIGETDKKIITITDREGDFFELIYELTICNEPFIIRSKHNRYTGETQRQRGAKIRTLLDESRITGEMCVTIQDVNTRECKTIDLKLKAVELVLPPPNKTQSGKNSKDYHAIKVNVVKAYNDEHEWIVLTSLPISSPEEIKKVVRLYRCRWHIEDYHKVLKTGYQIDEIYLHSSRQAVENMLALAAISACRLYWLIYVGRVEKSICADKLFKEFEWKCLYVYFKEKIPDHPPPLATIILKIARLGGYKNRKNAAPPGIKTLWIGFQKMTIAANMFESVLSMKT